MYGMDAISGWNRLLAVIPKDYRQLIDSSKAQTDFWVNLWVLSWLIIGEYLVLFLLSIGLGNSNIDNFQTIWVPIVGLFIAAIASWRARRAAVEWGDMVKASFDIFLPELGIKLRFAPPANREESTKYGAASAVPFLPIATIHG
jgi:hypothetical protein